MDRNALMTKIRGLLSKTVANGATEAEAATALQMAERLMAEHNIAIADTMDAGIGLEFASADAKDLGSRTPGFITDVIRVTDRVFGVEVVIRTQRYRVSNKVANHRVTIFGEASKVEAGAWGFNFLCDTFKRLWTQYRIATNAPKGLAASYFAGLADGFLAKLDDRAAEAEAWANFDSPALAGKAKNAIVKLDAALQQAFAEAFPDLKREVRTVNIDGSAYARGAADGRTINLARPVEQAARKAIAGG